MELEVTKKISRVPKVFGFLSFACSLIALAGLNVSMLLKAESLPDVLITQLPMLSIILGIMGLFTNKRSRLYAWWGIGLAIFIYVFLFLMFGLAWSINPKP